MKNDKGTLDCFAVVEVMGHQRIAGRITERNVAGTQMLQVDVPAFGESPGFTQLIGGASIYRIHPCDEQTCIMWVRSLSSSASPIVSWDGQQLIEKLVEKRLAGLPSGTTSDDDDNDNDL